MNKNLMSLGQVCDRVEAMSKNCTDRLIPVKEVEFDNLENMRIGSEVHKLRPIAQRSVCWRMGIPYHNLVKCPQELQRENMNYWWEKEKTDHNSASLKVRLTLIEQNGAAASFYSFGSGDE